MIVKGGKGVRTCTWIGEDLQKFARDPQLFGKAGAGRSVTWQASGYNSLQHADITEVRMQASPVTQSFAGQLIVGEGVAISGTLSIPGRVIIEGSLEGELQADELLVYPKGVVSAKVRVRTADIHGTTRQALEVAGYLCIRSTGRVHDRISCGEIEIERGGIVSGSVSFSGLPAELGAPPAATSGEAENLPSFAQRLTGT